MAFYLFFYIPGVIGKNTQAEAIEHAQVTVNQYKALRGYYAKYVVKPVLSHSDVTAVIDHKDNERAIPLPATMIHDLSKKLSTDGNLKLKRYSQYPFPNRTSRKLDQFQQSAWDFLTRNPEDIYSQTVERDGEGDLTQRLDERGSNEISDIAKHFNRFVEKIRLIMVQLSDNTNNITCMVNDIASRTAHSASFATNVTANSNHGQEQVSATMQTIISLCEEIKQASEITSRLAEESDEVGAVTHLLLSALK